MDRQIFEYACAQLEVDAKTAIYVGDNPIADISGANSAGIVSVFLKNERYQDCIDADYIISSFAELPDIIEQHHNRSQYQKN